MSGNLFHSPADIIRTLLIDLGMATAPSAGGDWPAYVAQEPDTPDSVITVYDTAGTTGGRLQTSGETVEQHGFQVRVRDANHFEGYEKARAIAVALDESVANAVVSVGDDVGTGSDTYIVYAVTRKGGIISLGKESPASKRSIFTINAVVALRQET